MVDYTSISQWNDVANSDAYQNADPDTQIAARSQFFDRVAEANDGFKSAEPAVQEAAKNQFIKKSTEDDWQNNVIDKQTAQNTLKSVGTDSDIINPIGMQGGQYGGAPGPSLLDMKEQAQSFATGAKDAVAKAGAGLGSLGARAIGLIPNDDIQEASKNAVQHASDISAAADADIASAKNTTAAKAGNFTGAAGMFLAGGEGGIGVKAIDDYLANAALKVAPETLAPAAQAGVKAAPNVGVTAAATEDTDPNNSTLQDVGERAKTGAEAGAIAAVAPPVLTGATKAGSWLLNLAKLGGGWINTLGSKEAGMAVAEQSAGGKLLKAAGGRQEFIDTVDNAQSKYDAANAQGANIQPTTTQLVPETQDILNSKGTSNDVRNKVNDASTQAKQALSEYAASTPNVAQAQAGEQAIAGKSQELTNTEQAAQQAQAQQGAEFTNAVRENPPQAIQEQAGANVMQTEGQNVAIKNKNYEIQKENQSAIPVDSSELAKNIQDNVKSSPYLPAALDKLQKFVGTKLPVLDDLGVAINGSLDGKTLAVGRTPTESPATLDRVTDIVNDFNDFLSPHKNTSVTPTTNEIKAITPLKDALQSYLDNFTAKTISETPLSGQAVAGDTNLGAQADKAINAGDVNFKSNVIPLRQQSLTTNPEARLNVPNPEDNVATGGSVPGEVGKVSRETAPYQLYQSMLNKTQNDLGTSLESVGVKQGGTGQATADLIRNDPEQSGIIKNYIKSKLMQDTVGSKGTVDFDKFETMLNDPKGYANDVKNLAPEDQKDLKDFYNGSKEYFAAQKDLEVKAAEENKPFIDLQSQLKGNKAATGDAITANPDQLDQFLSLSKDLSTDAQSAQKEWAKRMLLRPGGNVIKIVDNGSQEIDQNWVKNLTTSVAKGDETPEMQVVNKLYGSNSDIDSVVDMAKELGYNRPTGNLDPANAEHFAKAVGYSAGVRYGNINEISRIVKEFVNQNYSPVLQKALIDPAYAKQLALAYKENDYSQVGKMFSTATTAEIAGTEVAERKTDAKNANRSSNIAIPDNYTEPK